jgi:DNA-binding transcriptional MerR regulator
MLDGMDDVPEQLEPAALAARLGISDRTLRSWVKAGLIPRPPAHGHLTRFERRAIVIAHAVAALRRDGISLPQIARFLAKKSELELREIGGLPPPRSTPLLHADAQSGGGESETGLVSGNVVSRPDALALQGSLASREGPSGPGVPIGSEWRRIELLPGLELHVRADASPFVHGLAAAIAAGRFSK